ncbi:hypothetical protein BGZ63DRAFT_358034 [Mariannaea sp. PMI_226]|nr:hypothetical protein BGZ63DRAFT_358034 [Mariannaea sp. PMI_226]
MDLSIEDLLLSIDNESTMAMPFGQSEDVMPQSRGSSSEPKATNLIPSIESETGNQSLHHDGTNIDWQANFEQARAATTASPAELLQLDQDFDFSFLDQLGDGMELNTVNNLDESSHAPAMTAIDEFFIKNGAHRPTVPCNHCRRRRLQCLILKTTPANPNPTKACSSCVALFRECSLSGREKRVPSDFETLMPVIGHLHGVSEQDSPLEHLGEGQPSQQPVVETASAPALSSKRANTRSVRKTRGLKNWFSSHLDHPYPSEEEKVALAKESGLSKSQVVNWFANTRRRRRLAAHSHNNPASRVFLQGSPMPQQLGLSPMERWRNSPPEEEPASASAIESALSTRSSSRASMDNPDLSWLDGPGSSTSNDSIFYRNHNLNDISSGSASSCGSQHFAIEPSILSRSANSSVGEATPYSRPTSSRGKNSSFQAFQCTFCRQSYKKKYDWVRHERSIHLPGLDSWVCSVPVPPEQSHQVWRVNQSKPECIFCGQVSPTDEHMQSHEFESCAERPVSERVFTRKDHLWQHLHKFHRCRKWEGWKPDLRLLQHRQDSVQSCCGFCQAILNGWEERMDHLAAHFRAGLTMESWAGGWVRD